jgi:multidrug efflux system membrane fusion protein
MTTASFRRRAAGAVIVLAIGSAIAVPLVLRTHEAHGSGAAAPAASAPTVSAATVTPHDVVTWDTFSGRLEAVERVELRSRVAGAVQEIHFREGALVKQGDLLVTIDPAPYQAAVDAARAKVASAQSQLAWARKEQERGQQLLGMSAGAISVSNVDQRVNAAREADAALRAAEADLRAAELNLGYTEIRAPVSGRIGKVEVTVGNLIAAGPASPVLTTLVSVDPIYGNFDVDEHVVARALKALGTGVDPATALARIPVEMESADGTGSPIVGHLQLIDNQVDAQSGTMRLRAVFANPDGTLIPGQFARLRMGGSKTEPVIAIDERAIGTDQDKRFVMVVDPDDTASYREVGLGAMIGNLRIVTSGLNPGDRVIVDGLQRVRPGVKVNAVEVPMTGRTALTQR